MIRNLGKRDITGVRFGNLIACYPYHQADYAIWRWVCKCGCGNETIAHYSYLIAGIATSCGCLSPRLAPKGNA